MVLRRKARDFFPYSAENMGRMKKRILYYKGQIFEDMSVSYFKGNKAGNRPPSYCFKDTSTGIYWMIVEKVYF